jgi:nitrogen fixation/metabolism regulation signal transduction histidine kinase
VTVEGSNVIVADKGKGIPPEVLGRLASSPQEIAPGQAGRGLSIVTRICEVHSIAFSIRSGSSGTVARVGLLR